MKSQYFTSLGIALALTMTGAAAALAEEPANKPADVNNPTNSSINNAPVDSTVRHNSPNVSTDNTTSPANRSNTNMPMNSVNSSSTTTTMTSGRDLELSPLAMEILCRDFPLNSRCGNSETARTATLPNNSSDTTNRSYPYRSETDRRPAVTTPTTIDNSNTNPAMDMTPSTDNTSPVMPDSGTSVNPMPGTSR